MLPGSGAPVSGAGRTFRQATLPPRRVYVIGAVLVALGIVAGAVAAISAGPTFWIGIAATAVLLVAGALILLSRIRFQYHDGAVRLGLVPFYSTTIPLTDVASIDVIEYLQVRDAGGIGVRRRAGGGRALLYDAGPAIGLVTTDGRSFAVRSRYPGEAARAVREAGL